MSSVNGLYLVLLAAVAGYVLIARVPTILHTPMMSGSNFIHGIVLAGAMLALGSAATTVEQIIGFIAVTAAAANVVGGYIITDRMLSLFHHKSVAKVPPKLAGVENPASEDRRLPVVKSPPVSHVEPASSSNAHYMAQTSKDSSYSSGDHS